MWRLRRWRRHRAARLLIAELFSTAGPVKRRDELVVEAFLWRCHDEPRIAEACDVCRMAEYP